MRAAASTTAEMGGEPLWLVAESMEQVLSTQAVLFVNIDLEISILNNENCCSTSTTTLGGDSASQLWLVAQSMGEILPKQSSLKMCQHWELLLSFCYFTASLVGCWGLKVWDMLSQSNHDLWHTNSVKVALFSNQLRIRQTKWSLVTQMTVA